MTTFHLIFDDFPFKIFFFHFRFGAVFHLRFGDCPEMVPEDMAVGEVVMFWKAKGDPDDLSQYRTVCLEEVALKLVASIMLARLGVEVGETRQRPKTIESEKGASSSFHIGPFA